jgi:hypothetical protein
VEIICTSGSFASDITLTADEAPAEPVPFHSSVAYQNATSGEEIGGDQNFSVTGFTAGDAGANRAALVSGCTARDGPSTSVAITYGGSSPTTSLWNVTNSFNRNVGGSFTDAQIGTGAKTIQAIGSGGSGAIYFTQINVITMTGVDQTTMTGNVQTGAADSGSPSETVTGVGADDLVVDSWMGGLDSGNLTAGADQTARINFDDAGGNFNFRCASTQLGSAGGVMTWTKVTDYEYSGGAVAFKPVAGGGGRVPFKRSTRFFKQFRVR